MVHSKSGEAITCNSKSVCCKATDAGHDVAPQATWRPRASTSKWSRLGFWDVAGLIKHGFSCRLELQDCLQEASIDTRRLTAFLEPALEQQKAKQAAQVARWQQQLEALNAKLGSTSTSVPPPQQAAAAQHTQHAKPPAAPAAAPCKNCRDEKKRARLEARIHTAVHTLDLQRVVLRGNMGLLVWSGVLYILVRLCALAGPLLLQRIIKGLQCRAGSAGTATSCEPNSTMYCYCIGLVLAPALRSLAENHQIYDSYLVGTRMRNALMSAIYRKCLRLSNTSLQEESVGRVVTLMSNDAQKVQEAAMAVHTTWGTPCYILGVLIMLWYQIGWATMVGLAVLLLLGPLTGKVAARLGALRRQMVVWTDKRVGFMNEIVSGIQVLKFYAWEGVLSGRVAGARQQDERVLRRITVWQGLFDTVMFSGPVVVAIASFGAWSLAGRTLSIADAYTALSLFSLLRFPLSLLPMNMAQLVNGREALKRIGTFLCKAEAEQDVMDAAHPAGHVEVRSGDFSWDASAPTPTLRNLNLDAKPGTLTMVVGGMGSCKSSVLGALLGHMVKVQGTAKMGGRVAYVPQSAWIMNDTLRANILMGDSEKTMDLQRYRLALKVSQLGPDLESLPSGDLTEIGDRGTTLSGGQKQRVSIARAVYADADVYLLDDPLSAVDSHVGTALFEQCIHGVLKARTVILVTNALQYVPKADYVLWMEGGTVRGQGTYMQVVEQGLNIAELAHTDEPEGPVERHSEPHKERVEKAVEQVLTIIRTPKKGGTPSKRLDVDRTSPTSPLPAAAAPPSRLGPARLPACPPKAGSARLSLFQDDSQVDGEGPLEGALARSGRLLASGKLLPAPLGTAELPLERLQLGGSPSSRALGASPGKPGQAAGAGTPSKVLLGGSPSGARKVLELPAEGSPSRGRRVLDFIMGGSPAKEGKEGAAAAAGSPAKAATPADVLLGGSPAKEAKAARSGSPPKALRASQDYTVGASPGKSGKLAPLTIPWVGALGDGGKFDGGVDLNVELSCSQSTLSKQSGPQIHLVLEDTPSQEPARPLTGVEERESGSLSWEVVRTYLLAGHGLPVIFMLAALFAVEQGARVYTDRWVGIWFNNAYGQSRGFYLGVYFGIACAYGAVAYIRSLCFWLSCVTSAVNLHTRLLEHLLRLPKSFFDVNPSGRILNRFSRDVEIMDMTLPQSLSQFLITVAQYFAILVVICIVTPMFAATVVPLILIYVSVQRYYMRSARELQRLEAVSRSPIYSKFSEGLQGVATIRAYRKEAHFTQVSDQLMEQNAHAFMTGKLAASWLALRMDLIGLVVVAVCGVLVIQGGVDPGLAGLALMYAIDLTRFLKYATNMASKCEADFNSVERILQYLRCEPERDQPPEGVEPPSSSWPSLGCLELVDVTLRYRPGLPLVLKGVTFRVQGGEKVGVVGRTGSGKSSIFLAIFRLVDPSSGCVYIDGIDTRDVELRHLRAKLSIIPQDPFMFSGTIRSNLDPWGQHTDERLSDVLSAVGLSAAISALDGQLDAKVVDGGANFSLGQRQLLCWARAMLRNNRLLMMDEATASIDVETDARLQMMLATYFASCTILTIAHRLNTIMDSDQVVVLEQGRVAEVGHADDLLGMDAGVFQGMVDRTSKSSARYLRALASSSKTDRDRRGRQARWSDCGTGLGSSFRTDSSGSTLPPPVSARRGLPHSMSTDLSGTPSMSRASSVVLPTPRPFKPTELWLVNVLARSPNEEDGSSTPGSPASPLTAPWRSASSSAASNLPTPSSLRPKSSNGLSQASSPSLERAATLNGGPPRCFNVRLSVVQEGPFEGQLGGSGDLKAQSRRLELPPSPFASPRKPPAPRTCDTPGPHSLASPLSAKVEAPVEAPWVQRADSLELAAPPTLLAGAQSVDGISGTGAASLRGGLQAEDSLQLSLPPRQVRPSAGSPNNCQPEGSAARLPAARNRLSMGLQVGNAEAVGPSPGAGPGLHAGDAGSGPRQLQLDRREGVTKPAGEPPGHPSLVKRVSVQLTGGEKAASPAAGTTGSSSGGVGQRVLGRLGSNKTHND